MGTLASGCTGADCLGGKRLTLGATTQTEVGITVKVGEIKAVKLKGQS